ncbi:hypothetical protein [Terrisporobacter sp.]|uniref:hypothetical protein n=1 Tax=Terrisporobacter sp. TaxID=1965305 RepID=UPI00289C75CD|nr:hypothetical protein [Terrisporobacter sp.]
MKILNLDRGKGKTTELIKVSNEKWIYIVCADRKRAENISRMAMEMSLNIPFPITVNELPIRSPYIKEVLLDDVEDVLTRLIRKPVLIATTSCGIVDEI